MGVDGASPRRRLNHPSRLQLNWWALKDPYQMNGLVFIVAAARLIWMRCLLGGREPVLNALTPLNSSGTLRSLNILIDVGWLCRAKRWGKLSIQVSGPEQHNSRRSSCAVYHSDKTKQLQWMPITDDPFNWCSADDAGTSLLCGTVVHSLK
jgi:hypothetical protein